MTQLTVAGGTNVGGFFSGTRERRRCTKLLQRRQRRGGGATEAPSSSAPRTTLPSTLNGADGALLSRRQPLFFGAGGISGMDPMAGHGSVAARRGGDAVPPSRSPSSQTPFSLVLFSMKATGVVFLLPLRVGV
ncbi:uncharacterized protein LOC110266916 [Arachis ipaensis]|uniref:uncharacterized protein LOC110266916 n=1 Tax=Arachis ipaensis TaxID=130454 RepID=UPI000A2B138E|nr:uncharacterized protein LOC110266916 [Arachis ipaensis]